ncbi:DNA-directed DNA polymerase [Tanacetum coccineum]
MEEIVNKFIEEGKREHEEMDAFIREFRTTNELLLKERNNSLSELEFEVYGLSRAINKAQMGLLSNKARLEEACTVTMDERYSAVLLNKLPSKEKDPGSFTIPCDIGHLHIDNALADLGASISLMPYTMYKKLGLGEPKLTRMSLELADRSIQYPLGIAEDMFIKIDKFVIPIDFVILDMREDSRIPIILRRPFLATARAMINVFNKKITLRVGSEEVIFDVDQSMKKPHTEDDECYGIDDLDTIPIRRIDHINTPYSHERHKQEETLNEHLYFASAIEIDENRPELKDLPSHLEYAYLKGDESCLVIILSKLMEKEKTSLPRSVIQPQRRLNSKVQDVVKDEIVRLLNSGLIYPISDSPWVSPIHVVLKKGGMAVVLNDNNKLIPSRTVTGWRMCIDYHKLNDATRKDHFPLLFIDQMLERLSGNEYYCFLDGFLGFFQIPIAPEDQEKTTFTCPCGTFPTGVSHPAKAETQGTTRKGIIITH